MKNRFFTRGICVCAHLTQTRYAQKTCAEMRINMSNSVKNIMIVGGVLPFLISFSIIRLVSRIDSIISPFNFWSQCPKVKKSSYKISPITALPLFISIIPFLPFLQNMLFSL